MFWKKEKKIDEPSLKVPTFEIEIILSDKAEKLLKRKKESVVVSVHFYGYPLDKDLDDFSWNKYGYLDLGRAEIELMENRIAIFDNATINQRKFEYLEYKDFELNINVFTGRRSSKNNLICVSSYGGVIGEVSGRRITLEGKLISETFG